MLAVDNMVLHKTGPRPDLAYQFINFMLDGKNARRALEHDRLGQPQRGVDAVHRRRGQEQPRGVPAAGRAEEAAAAQGLRRARSAGS